MENVHEMPEQDALAAIEVEKEEAAEVLEQVHHVNGDANDNTVSNLRIVEVLVEEEGSAVVATGDEKGDAQVAAAESEQLTYNRKFVAGLREVAAFYEAHPEVKLPHEAPGDYGRTLKFYIFGAKKPEMVIGVKAMGGKVEKFFDDDVFKIRKTFPSGAELEFYSSRDVVCERIPDGEEVVPERIVPAKPEEIIPATRQAKYRYRCHALLAPEGVDTEKVEEAQDGDQPF